MALQQLPRRARVRDTARGDARAGGNTRTARRDDALFVGPAVLLFGGILGAGFVLGLWYSLVEWNGVSREMTFIGLENYSTLLSDGRMRGSAWFTARFALVTTVLSNLMGLGLALLVTQPAPFQRLYRAMFFLPNVIGGILLGFIFRFVFSTAFDSLGELTGFGLFQLPWLGTPATGFWGTVIVFMWRSSGYLMAIYVAAIVSVDEDLYEAARVDGASWLQSTRRITLPLIMPAVTVGVFLMLSISSKLFDVIFALTNGGPYGSTEAFALNIYNEAFIYNNLGLASAKAVVFFVAVGVLTLVQVRFTQRREVER